MDMDQYMDVFIEESKEHLQALNDGLLQFEKNTEDASIVDQIFRSAHTLKGMSATMEFEDIASLTHQMENLLDNIRNGQLAVTNSMVDVLFECVDILELMVFHIIDGGDGKKDVSDLVERLTRLYNGQEAALEVAATTIKSASVATDSGEQTVEQETEDESSISIETNLDLNEYEYTVLTQSMEAGYHIFEIQVALREDCVLKAARAYMVFELLGKEGEVVKSLPSVEKIEEEDFDSFFQIIFVSQEEQSFIEALVHKVSEIESVHINEIHLPKTVNKGSNGMQDESETLTKSQTINNSPNNNDPEKRNGQSQGKTIRVNIERLDRLMNLFSEMVIDRGRLEQLSDEINNGELNETIEHMNRISSDLQDLIFNMRMVPIEQVFNRFPRMVRGVTKELQKEIDLQISGSETELDRTVIDEIGDPLIHLLRNAIDHGVEMPDIRQQQGKSRQGTVQLRAFHSGNHVFIEIEDDGQGIHRERILSKALERGLIKEAIAQELTDQEVYQFLFHPGFSTADEISDISGRGVGLDVVSTKIESLGGIVSVDSERGKGSKFSIQLPLTLSIISGMLVQVADEKFAIPLSSIIETAVFKKQDIRSVHGQKVIDFRGKVIPLISLQTIFEVPREEIDEQVISIVMVKKGEKTAGLIVDSFIGQQEVVLKSLGDYLRNVFGISGATILGDGQVALIIDCNTLMK